MKDLSIDHHTANMRALPIALALLALVLVPHAAIYRESALTALFRAIGIWWLVPAFIASIVVHELLHAAAVVVFGRLPWNEVTYGVNWQTLTPYAHPKRPISARVYRATLAAPGIVLGALPAVTGLVMGSGAWSGYGAIMLAAASGDLLVYWSLRRTPGSARVQDHPSRVGCLVEAS